VQIELQEETEMKKTLRSRRRGQICRRRKGSDGEGNKGEEKIIKVQNGPEMKNN